MLAHWSTLSGEAGKGVSVPTSGSEAQSGSEHPCIHAFPHFFHAPPQDAGIDESDQLSVPEGFHEFADMSPVSLETEDKILNGKCTLAGPHLTSDVVGGLQGADRDASSRDEQPRLESEAAFHRSPLLGRGAASEHVPAGQLSVSAGGAWGCALQPVPQALQ